MRVLIATDAWHPQVNGVVRTYASVAREVAAFGAELAFLTPTDFRTLPCPTYPEIRLALAGPGTVARKIEAARADHIHIATEGPIGFMARRSCGKLNHPFTTSYHTRFPEYVSARLPIPERFGYALQRRFHAAARCTMVPSPSLACDLRARGFERLAPWTRGVDTDRFRPRAGRMFGPAPVFLCVSRIAVEKNIEAFLGLSLPGRKVLVGGGPALDAMRSRYGDVLFTGPLQGEALSEAYASADVFVFPSRTDTFGLVLLEALASGVPVAAYPVTGPKDVIASERVGVLDDDLGHAALAALDLRAEECRHYALGFGWAECARQFVRNVEVAGAIAPS